LGSERSGDHARHDERRQAVGVGASVDVEDDPSVDIAPEALINRSIG
jgi:hypothetical protein